MSVIKLPKGDGTWETFKLPAIRAIGDDFNTFTTFDIGFDAQTLWRSIISPFTNKPTDMNQSSGNIPVYMPYEGSANTGIQVVYGTIGNDSGKIWMRRCDSGTWSDWSLVAGGQNTIDITCATAATTAAKVGTTANGGYIPTVGDTLTVTFTLGCNVSTPTLNIDGSGAKNIRLGNANVTTAFISTTSALTIQMWYDGTYYQIYGSLKNDNTTYSEITSTEITDGTSTTLRTITGRRAQEIVNKARNQVVTSTDNSVSDWITVDEETFNTMLANNQIIQGKMYNVVGNSIFTTGSTPVGAISTWFGLYAKIPANYLAVEGQALSASIYTALFDRYGYTYGGSGDTFYLPNLKGKVIVHLDTGQTEFNTLGKIGGEKTHTLTIDEMPAHDHTISQYDNAMDGYIYPTNREASGQYGGKTGSSGGGQAHNNLQPYIVGYYIIKVREDAYTEDLYNLDLAVNNLKEVVLYNNATGTTGTVTLSDSSANYTYLEIYFNKSGCYGSVKIYQPNGKDVALFVSNAYDTGLTQDFTSKININGTSITKLFYMYKNYNASGFTGAGIANEIVINRVVGYK
jgi:microcystin-dependent protein